MKKNVLFPVAAAVAVLGAALANADGHEAAEDRYLELWKCKVNEGKTIDDVKAVNSKWVKLINENVDGGDVNSYVLTPVVGKQGGFMYADTFPSIAAWEATREVMESDKGKEIEKELEATAKCESNSLHRSSQS